MSRSRGEQLVKGRYRERQAWGGREEGENGVYDCNRLGGRTARVAPAVLPIIAGAFVAPSLLSKSPFPSLSSPPAHVSTGNRAYQTMKGRRGEQTVVPGS